MLFARSARRSWPEAKILRVACPLDLSNFQRLDKIALEFASGGAVLRKQYHFRPGPDGLKAWDIDRLIVLASELPTIQVPLSEIRELDEPYWYEAGVAPTCRSNADHARLIEEADLSFPVILSCDGRVLDGMHRIAKAAMLGMDRISAKKFATDPDPDHVGFGPDELLY